MSRNLYRQPARTRQRSTGNWPVFWAVMAVLAAAPFLYLYFDPTPPSDTSAATVVVREGDGWNEATEQLEQKGLVRRPLSFKAIVLLSGARARLMPGRYSLRPGTSSRDIIAALTGSEAQSSITIPEGYRLEQIGEKLVEQGLATRQEWESALRTPPESPLLAARPDSAGLEGYIYPDNYRFTEANAAEQLVREGVRNLEERLTPDLRAGIRSQGLTLHEGLTLASIVEREAQAPQERPIIASVFLNRLATDETQRRLQADPTVQYGVGTPGEWWKRRLSRTDLRVASPYNTYVNPGLPPSPIANPGIAAIKAVASPARTQYLYFVAKGDGSHAFAATLEEHNRNVQDYVDR